jgi:hypothetical protein
MLFNVVFGLRQVRVTLRIPPQRGAPASARVLLPGEESRGAAEITAAGDSVTVSIAAGRYGCAVAVVAWQHRNLGTTDFGDSTPRRAVES